MWFHSGNDYCNYDFVIYWKRSSTSNQGRTYGWKKISIPYLIDTGSNPVAP